MRNHANLIKAAPAISNANGMARVHVPLSQLCPEKAGFPPLIVHELFEGDQSCAMRIAA